MLLPCPRPARTPAPRKPSFRAPQGHSLHALPFPPPPHPAPLPIQRAGDGNKDPVSRPEERGVSLQTRPLLSPKPQPSQFSSALLVLTLWGPAGSPPIKSWGGSFSSFNSLHYLPSPLGPPTPLGAPSELRNSGGVLTGWGMKDWRRGEGRVLRQAPSPRAGEAGSDSRGDRLRGQALVLQSVSKKHRRGDGVSTVGEGREDPHPPQTARRRSQGRTAKGGLSGGLGSHSPGVPRPLWGEFPAAPPRSAPAPTPRGQGAALAAGR